MSNPIPQLEIITGKDLLAQTIAPLEYTIGSILPHGLFILAGSSKIGKSWLALDMSRAVASGGTLWQFSTTQGEVDEAPKWSGTATQLCAALIHLDATFYVSPISLSKTLRTSQQFLLSQYGIAVDFDRNKNARSIELSRVIIIAEYENVNQEPPRLVV